MAEVSIDGGPMSGDREGVSTIDRPATGESRAPSAAPAPNPGRLYAAIWRWHFYAGLITSPILWVLAITGALYVFRTELADWRDRAWLVVEPGPRRLGYDALREIAARESGTDEVDAVVVRAEPDRSVRFVVHAGGEHGAGEQHRDIYIDPYTGRVLGSRIQEQEFFAIVLDLHRSLMMGTTGRVLGELATCWALLLLATGMYLWWPRGKKNVGVWAPRVRGKTYAVLRDWHAVVGAYLLPIMALIAFTGLIFSVVMGTGFNTAVQKAGHWPKEWFASPKSEPPHPGARPAPLDRVVPAFLANSRPEDVVIVRLAAKPTEAHQGFLMRDEDKNTLRIVAVDQYAAEPILVSDKADVPFLYKVRLWSVSIHMGKIFGMPTKILALVASLGLLGLSLTGAWMWWQRRPGGRSGFPRRPPARSVPRWGWGVVAAAGLLLPVAGASMILIGLLDLAASPLRRRSDR